MLCRACKRRVLVDVGNEVFCVDSDANKIDMLTDGAVPIYEPGSKELIARNLRTRRLAFATDIGQGVAHGPVQIIAVGTPADEDGSAVRAYDPKDLFRNPDFDVLKNLKERIIFDGRNLYDPSTMKREGFVYYAIGR